ncbi:hypothetical protein HMPREF6745_2336, partial [Prevotella sp. oral taxon 472 str. F0295]
MILRCFFFVALNVCVMFCLTVTCTLNYKPFSVVSLLLESISFCFKTIQNALYCGYK